MAGSTERAINMALRVKGIGDVQRDFKKVGDAGTREFERVEKAASKAAKATQAATSPKVTRSQPRTSGVGAGLASSGFNAKALGGGVGDANDTLDIFIPKADGAAAASGRLGAALGAMATIAGAAVVSGLLAAAGAAVAGAVAFAEHERAIDAFNATLDLAGNLSTASSKQIEAMATAVVDATLQTEKSVLQAAASLAQVPGITEEALQGALEASALLADALGKDVTDTAEQAGEILTALADRDMKALVEAMDGLNPSLQLTILNLAEAGKTAEAQTALINGLRDAAGDGPNGLTSATNRLSDSWDRFKQSLGETSAGPISSVLDYISERLDNLRRNADATGMSMLQLLSLNAGLATTNFGVVAGGPAAASDQSFNGRSRGSLAGIRQNAKALRDRREYQKRAARITSGGSRKRRSGGRGGKSDAQRAAEKAAREAEALAKRQAREAETTREAADRIAESNQDVIDSYAQRVRDITATIGLEGAALKAVERQQEIEAAARRINTELIEKEVEARRAAAVVAGKQFDEAAATAEATAMVEKQAAEVRKLAGEYIDAADAIDLFNEKQAFAKNLFEETRTPVEALVLEAKRLTDEFNRLGGDADAFNRKMDQLAEQIVDSADRSRNAWVGFGDDVGGVFTDLLLNGGSARDVLQELIRLPLERLLVQNVQNPIAGFVDSLTGNNRDKNIASARAGLPVAADGATISVTALGGSADLAAQALSRIPIAAQSQLGGPLANLATDAQGASVGLGELIPLTGQFGGVLGQLIATLSAGGGGGGFLGAVLSIAGSALGAIKGSGLAIDGGSLGASLPGVEAYIASLPGNARGGMAPRSGAFWVGENGRELAEYTSQGLRIHSNENVRRFEGGRGGGFQNTQIIQLTERTDPRRAASQIARATQHSYGIAARKGLAVPPGRRG